MNEGPNILSNYTDYQQLWRKFQQGDENALATIYSGYFDHLYNYGFKFTRDTTLVEDCIQELFIKLLRNRKNLGIPDSIRNYLFKAFRSYMFDKLEKDRKHTTIEISESVQFDLEPDHEVILIRREDQANRQDKLNEAIKSLTPRQREAIFLKYEEGFSYPEIAELLGLTQKAAYKLVGRAIQTLRGITNEDMETYQKKIEK